MTGVAALTVPAVTVKVAEVCPCGIVTVAGTLAAVVLELESDTVTPPLPAAAVRLTVPVADTAAGNGAGVDRKTAERRLRRVYRYAERLVDAGV